MQEDTTTTQRTLGSKSNGKWKAQSLDSKSSEASVSGIQDQIVDGAKKAYDTVVEKANDAFSGFDANPTTFIRQYPVQAAIGGVVVGMLLGAALGRRTIVK